MHMVKNQMVAHNVLGEVVLNVPPYRVDVVGAVLKRNGLDHLHLGWAGPVSKDNAHYYRIHGGNFSWAWRAEGHHVSLHFSIWGDRVISNTPFFFGANPAEVRKGSKTGLRILGDREDIAFELMSSLDEKQTNQAVILDSAPADILSYNSSKVSFAKEEGLPASQMTGSQKETFLALVAEYVGQVHSELAEEKLNVLKRNGPTQVQMV